MSALLPPSIIYVADYKVPIPERSEERRVGKECRL